MKEKSPYDRKYEGEQYYWGKKPSAMCDKVLEIVQPTPDFRPKLIDLGCGEGRNAVYFAKHGFEVFGLDLSLIGLDKMKRYAEVAGIHVEPIHANIINYQLEGAYDVVFSSGTLHYLPPVRRELYFKHYKKQTTAEGIHAISVFVEKPFIPKAPDAEVLSFPYKSGELFSYYWDWEILYCTEEIFDCMFSGIPHKHAVNRIITRRYRSSCRDNS